MQKADNFSGGRGGEAARGGLAGGLGGHAACKGCFARRRDFSGPARRLAGGAGKRGRSGSEGGEIDARRVSGRRGGARGAEARARRRRKAYPRLFSHSRPKIYPF